MEEQKSLPSGPGAAGTKTCVKCFKRREIIRCSLSGLLVISQTGPVHQPDRGTMLPGRVMGSGGSDLFFVIRPKSRVASPDRAVNTN